MAAKSRENIDGETVPSVSKRRRVQRSYSGANGVFPLEQVLSAVEVRPFPNCTGVSAPKRQRQNQPQQRLVCGTAPLNQLLSRMWSSGQPGPFVSSHYAYCTDRKDINIAIGNCPVGANVAVEFHR